MYAVLVVILLATFTWLWVKNARGNKNYPPGPWELPIIGSLPRLNPDTPQFSLVEIAKKYGKNGACRLHLGTVETVVLTDHRLIREAFASDKFTGRAPLFLTHGIMKGNGIICAEGELWRDQRKLLVSWIRSMGASKTSQNRSNMEYRINTYVENLIKKLHSRDDLEESIDMTSVLSNSMGLLVMSLVLGVNLKDDDPTWEWLQHIQEDGAKAMGVAGIVNFLPFFRFLSKSIRKTMDTIVFGQMQTHNIYRCCIELRRFLRKHKTENTNPVDYDQIFENSSYRDGIKCIHYSIDKTKSEHFHIFKPTDLIISEEECFADYFLSEQESRMSNNEFSKATKRLSDTQMIFLLADLFGAGLDTTLFSLSWFFLFMGLYPDEQENVRSEIISFCGHRSPSLDDMQHLVYTKAALYESQRLRPIVPLGIPHGCVQDTTLGEYFISKGTMVIPFQWAIHTDPDHWKDSLEYRPSRFVGENNELLSPPYFIPFQTGKRMCPGDDLARTMMFLYATHMISKFELSLDGIPSRLNGELGITLQTPPYKMFIRPLSLKRNCKCKLANVS